MFFVQPFEAFDELFKFHVFLRQGTWVSLYRCADSAVLGSPILGGNGLHTKDTHLPDLLGKSRRVPGRPQRGSGGLFDWRSSFVSFVVKNVRPLFNDPGART